MESAFRNIWTRFLLAFVALTLLAGTVWAQGTGEITGLVTDSTGAVVSGVEVKLSNAATGEVRTTVTTAAGLYTFPALPIVGTYTLEIAAKGFKSTKVQNIIASVGTVTSRDVKLEIGVATEQVTVEADAETVQITESSVSQLVDRRIWQQMPLDDRNQNRFIELVAGAVPQDGTNNNRGAAVNGTREGAGSYLVEGTDNNEQGQAGRGQISTIDKGGAATSISPDAIQEYRVITNSYSAEYGKGGGFITDTVLRGGTNKWHGSAFEYNRIQALTANDWFSNQSHVKDRLVRNQFGGSIGGPIIKDKTFFYGTVEFHRDRQTLPTGAVQATTQQFLDFVQSGGLENWMETDPAGFCAMRVGAPCPGAFASIATQGATFQALKGKFPYPVANAPDCASGGDCVSRGLYTAGLVYPVPIYSTINLSVPQPLNELRWSVKFDHRLGEKDQISATYLFQDALTRFPLGGGNSTIGPPTSQDGRGQNLAVTWNHTFTPALLNTFKAGYLRHKLNFPTSGGTNTPTFNSLFDGMGVDLGVATGLPQFFTDNQFQYLDTMSLQKGKHSLKFGGEYRRTRNGSSFFNDAFSTVYPWSVEDEITDLNFTGATENLLFGGPYYGAAYLATAAVVPATGKQPDPYRGYRANEFAFFVQDDFRVNSRLTVNLGLRWEYFGPPHNFQKNIDSNFYFGSPVTPVPTATNNPFFPVNSPFYASLSTGTFQVRNNEIWNKDTNNFGPRVGFAWDALGTQKLVVRAGAGIMYDRIYNNLFENIRFNPPFFSDNQIGIFANNVPVDPVLLQFPFTDTSRALFNNPAFKPKPNPRHMNQNIVAPYYQQLHAGVQWEIARGYVFEPEYIATLGTQLIGLMDVNTFDGRRSGAGSSARVNPDIGRDNFRTNGFSSNYHGLQLSLRKTYSAGLSLTANYTYSKALDTISDAFNNRRSTSPTDVQNIRYDYGPADFDTRHRFVSTLSYDLPFWRKNRWIGGWGVNSIISFQTGHPVSPYSSSNTYDLNHDGHFSDRLVPIGSPMSTVLGSGAANACTAAVTVNGGVGKCYFDTNKWVLYDPQGLVDSNGKPIGSCPLTVNQGFWCDVPIGRNTLFGPKNTVVDFSATKTFKITESSSLTFQANFFDLFNHPNFQPPTADITSSNFGQSVLTLGDNGGHRITQLAVRFDF
jgi:hypothetical protein